MGLTDKGIGDWIMVGLGNLGEFLGDKVYYAIHPDEQIFVSEDEVEDMDLAYAGVSGHAR